MASLAATASLRKGGSCSVINRLFAFCLLQRRLIAGLACVILIGGFYTWSVLPVEAYPDLGGVSVSLTTQMTGFAAEEIEQKITLPLERALAGTPGLTEVRSSSTFGLSLITLIFQDDADVYFERQRVSEQIAQATLPAGVTASLNPVTSPAGEIYRYTLESDQLNLMQLSELQRWLVIPTLQMVTGVAGINNFGGYTAEYQVVLDPMALARYNLSANDVADAMSQASINVGGGRTTRGEQDYILRGVGLVKSLDDIANTAITTRQGSPIFIRDVGRLHIGHQVREGILGKDQNPDTLEGIVTMLTGQNPSLVLAGIHQKVNELQQTLRPLHAHIVPYIDRDDLVQATVDRVIHTMLEGIGLVCLVLLVFLGSPRSACIVATTIPFSLAGALIAMHLFKMPANLFSLGAIDFGVIVDAAIVVVEAIVRYREDNPEKILGQNDVLRLLNDLGRPIIIASVIIIIAYAPLFAFEAQEGRLFRPIAMSVSFALAYAFVCAITLIPGLAYVALRQPRPSFHFTVFHTLQNRFRALLDRLLQRPRWTYLIGAVIVTATVFLAVRTPREFLPELDEGSLWMQVQLPTGIALDQASQIASNIRRTVKQLAETKTVVTQLGRNDSGTDPWTPSHIEAAIVLTPYNQWPDHETKAEFIGRLRQRLDTIPGITYGLSQPIADGLNDLVGGAHSPLVLRVYGDDTQMLRQLGNQIVAALGSLTPHTSASIFQEPPIPQITLTINRQAIAQYGIKVTDVMRLIQTVMGGSPVGQLYQEDRLYNVTAIVPTAVMQSVAAIGALTVPSPSGSQIPLRLLTHIHLQTGESTIAHEQTHRQITIRLDNGDLPLSTYLTRAYQALDQQLKYDHQRIRLEWAGNFQQQQRAQTRLAIAFAIILILMTFLLFIAFGRLRQALLVIAMVALVAFGGLVALRIRGDTLNIATAVGFIALLGVAIQNAVLLIAHINRLRLHHDQPLRQAVINGTVERFRPVLMTATVASIGMLPAALSHGIGTDVQRGLATVVVGGLGIATILTLVILPTYYFVLERWIERQTAGKH